jgi:hypothetical protein
MRDDLNFLKDLAQKAISSGEDKWASNTQLISWFRSSPVEVIEALEAAYNVRKRPGGLTHAKLDEALSKLPRVNK